ncbi:hypothetical protein V5O48_011805 [Marasmius crinis-equi]|uniref:Uncharacterized protein n=1 Tax=Marasmius crinis-equi TaxID=585013 RepID=A0ABR3F532_9AGAR
MDILCHSNPAVDRHTQVIEPADLVQKVTNSVENSEPANAPEWERWKGDPYVNLDRAPAVLISLNSLPVELLYDLSAVCFPPCIVPRMLVPAHQRQVYYRYLIHIPQLAGVTDSEGTEWEWARYRVAKL